MEAWWQVLTLRRKCAALLAAPAGELPGAPPNTPATDTEASVAWSTGPELTDPTGTYLKPLPGINVPSSNQFIPTSGWTKLPNPRDTPATSTKYRTPFDELDLELGRSSLIEIPLSRFETEEAVDSLLKQCPDLTGRPSHDVEMTDMTYTPTPVAARSPSDSRSGSSQRSATLQGTTTISWTKKMTLPWLWCPLYHRKMTNCWIWSPWFLAPSRAPGSLAPDVRSQQHPRSGSEDPKTPEHPSEDQAQ